MLDDDPTLEIRVAREEDVPAIREVFLGVYGEDYPYQNFFDDAWLKRSVFTDDILMLVAIDRASGEVLGTSSVVFEIGAHSDLLGEFGRLAVLPSARGRGLGKRLMQARLQHVSERLHIGMVENRTAHRRSQAISERFGFSAVGFLPLKHMFLSRRESVAVYWRDFGQALRLRRNNPRLVPEAYPLASLAMKNCKLDNDLIVDESAPPYPHGEDLELSDMLDVGLEPLLRIERGRVAGREIFGPMRLNYGFFKLQASRADYIVARLPSGSNDGPILGAIGYIHDHVERGMRIFEIIAQRDEVIRPLLEALLRKAREELDVVYLEVDVSAHAPRMQRSLIELGFLPAAYLPAMAFHEVERLDILKMVRLFGEFAPIEVDVVDSARPLVDLVIASLEREQIMPQIAAAIPNLELFAGLSQEQAERLAMLCAPLQIEDGAQVFATGQEAEAIYLLLDGQVAIKRDGRAVGQVHTGEVLGEVSTLMREQHSASAHARGPLRLAAISSQALETLTRQRPDIAVILYQNLARDLGRKLRRVSDGRPADTA